MVRTACNRLPVWHGADATEPQQTRGRPAGPVAKPHRVATTLAPGCLEAHGHRNSKRVAFQRATGSAGVAAWLPAWTSRHVTWEDVHVPAEAGAGCPTCGHPDETAAASSIGHQPRPQGRPGGGPEELGVGPLLLTPRVKQSNGPRQVTAGARNGIAREGRHDGRVDCKLGSVPQEQAVSNESTGAFKSRTRVLVVTAALERAAATAQGT